MFIDSGRFFVTEELYVSLHPIIFLNLYAPVWGYFVRGKGSKLL